ncbi:Smr/MutS family protein [Desulfotalea psychrophila]|uniref:Smr/MutS family protein n=1 Tax=Desulfotalea psychrophila TaxID=84980 RepID=UPI0002D4E164|nr:Smr/MutS family protein [Desulfotalea psychrophila]
MCDVCGNEIGARIVFCPFCGIKQERELVCKKEYIQRLVNLEHGLPFVEAALKRLDRAVLEAGQQGVTQLTLIHGYGSSGKGGVIREESRKMLDFMWMNGELKKIVFGEDFTKSSGEVRDLIRRYPILGQDRNLNKANRGITLVFF